jgi:hypothetical protein
LDFASAAGHSSATAASSAAPRMHARRGFTAVKSDGSGRCGAPPHGEGEPS